MQYCFRDRGQREEKKIRKELATIPTQLDETRAIMELTLITRKTQNNCGESIQQRKGYGYIRKNYLYNF